MEIISLSKVYNMTGANVVAKTGAKIIEKAPRSKYLLFLMKHLDKMTEKH